MAQKIDEWIETAVKKYSEYPIDQMSNLYFFRDPPRPQIINDEFFFSPCDGIILYQTTVHEPTESVLEIKGQNYSVQDILQDKYFNKPSLVIGTFMTFYHPHVQRVPSSGTLTYNFLKNIYSRNLPMLFIEKNIFEGKFPAYGFDYLKQNERLLCTFYNPHLKYTYYVVIIADSDVNSIMLFQPEQARPYSQNERFCFIRWGSQVDVILPLDDRYHFEVLNNVTDAVEAGLDPLVKIHKIKQ